MQTCAIFNVETCEEKRNPPCSCQFVTIYFPLSACKHQKRMHNYQTIFKYSEITAFP